MISSILADELQQIFRDRYILNPGEGHTNVYNVIENMYQDVINLVSELEEECTFLHEKVERLEYDLGLTGLEGVKDDNAG